MPSLRNSVSQSRLQVISDGSNQTHTITGVGLSTFGNVVEIDALVRCAYAKTDSGYKDLLADDRIPDPACGGYVYAKFDVGEIAIDSGIIRVGGAVDAGVSQRISIVYISS